MRTSLRLIFPTVLLAAGGCSAASPGPRPDGPAAPPTTPATTAAPTGSPSTVLTVAAPCTLLTADIAKTVTGESVTKIVDQPLACQYRSASGRDVRVGIDHDKNITSVASFRGQIALLDPQDVSGYGDNVADLPGGIDVYAGGDTLLTFYVATADHENADHAKTKQLLDLIMPKLQ